MLSFDWTRRRPAVGIGDGDDRDDDRSPVCVELSLTVDSPWFAGHFPARPLLPAIAQLALVAQVRAREAGRGGGAARLEGLKFRAPIGPGARVGLRLAAPDRGGAERFEIDVDGRTATRGTWLATKADLGTRDARDLLVADAAPGRAAAPLPHVGPARWIRSARPAGPAVWLAVAEAPGGSPFVDDGRAPAFVALELAAQTAAAAEAAEATGAAGGTDGTARPRSGYLVQARGVELAEESFAVDRPVPVRIELDGRAGPLSLYRFAVGRIAEGVVGTYLERGD